MVGLSIFSRRQGGSAIRTGAEVVDGPDKDVRFAHTTPFGNAIGDECYRGRARLSRWILLILIPNIGALGVYFGLFRPKMSDIAILIFF